MNEKVLMTKAAGYLIERKSVSIWHEIANVIY